MVRERRDLLGHTVGFWSRRAMPWSRQYRLCVIEADLPSRVVASTCRPAARSRSRRPTVSASASTGTEKMLPAEDRTHFPLKGRRRRRRRSSRPPHGAGQPDQRAGVTGVGHLGGDHDQRRSSGQDLPRVASGSRQTATRPAGVTVSDNAFIALSVTAATGRPPSGAPWRCRAASVAKTRSTKPCRAAASTKLGPSANRPQRSALRGAAA